jgi:Sulfotransferase family
MDTIFSAYKHEFPPGTLDYTSNMEALAELYHAYRDLIEHWDQVLPGRVTHVRYQDMVNDMPGVARAIIGESCRVRGRTPSIHSQSYV